MHLDRLRGGFNPLSPRDAIKHHLRCLNSIILDSRKQTKFFQQPGILERKYLQETGLPIHGNFL